MPIHYIIFILIIISGAIASIRFRKLTSQAALTGSLLSLLIFTGTGWPGFLLMTCFFVLGTLATAWKKHQKEELGVAESNKGRRTVQVIANAGFPALAGGLAIIFPDLREILLLIIAAAFSSAAADTISSEMGTVYGKRFFNILSFKPDKKGLDGVVSIEGIIIGIAGSAVIASLYALFKGWDHRFLWIIISGTAGNLTDSLLGAAFERKGLMGNEMVNFLNTLCAGLIILLLNN